MEEITKCVVCGDPIVQKSKGRPRKTCSRRCRDVKRGATKYFEKNLRNCQKCNKQFIPRTSNHYYCSAQCRWLDIEKKIYVHSCNKCHKMYQNNRPISNHCSKECYESYNKRAIKKRRNKKEKYRRVNDPYFSITTRSQSILSRGIRVGTYGERWKERFVFTLDQFITHIENKFKEGMSLDNYGDWEIDHIKPKSSFYYEDINDKEFVECWSLDNIQPLWKSENMAKGRSYARTK